MKYFLLLCLFSVNLIAADGVVQLDKVPSEIKLVIPQHCMFGDFDLVLHDSIYKKDIKVFLSVKSLASGKEVIIPIFEEYFIKVEPSDEEKNNALREKVKKLMTEGVSYKINPKLFSEQGNYLITICSDSSAKPSCFTNKKVEEIGTLIKAYQNPDKNYVPGDHVYYMQLLRKNGNKVSFLKKTLNESNEKNLKSDFKLDSSAVKDLKTLKSFPFIGKGVELVIGLPVFAKQKCGTN